VVARTSSFSFERSGYEVPRIARLLEVEYILQGDLRREGDRLRVGVELVDRDGFQVWNGTFTQVTGDENFTLQDAIADAVVTKLAPQLLPLPVGVMQPGFEAFQHYLIGHELMIRRPEGFARSARVQFDRAILIEATDDVQAIYNWYEDQRAGLGREFEQALGRVQNIVERAPESYPLVYRTLRRALMRRFPYSVYFSLSEDRIEIHAVLHTRRHPRRWQRRV
jgi:plasmid stabilization system protein ParE